MPSIKCGNCKETHDSIQAVRACYGNGAAEVAHKVTPVTPAVEGMYILDGRIFKVQRAIHGSGQLYAKELQATKFDYAPGMYRRLNSSHRMTLEQAKEYGALYGTCCVCGRTLTDEKSIAEGIGPVCATRF